MADGKQNGRWHGRERQRERENTKWQLLANWEDDTIMSSQIIPDLILYNPILYNQIIHDTIMHTLLFLLQCNTSIYLIQYVATATATPHQPHQQKWDRQERVADCSGAPQPHCVTPAAANLCSHYIPGKDFRPLKAGQQSDRGTPCCELWDDDT